MTIKIARNLKKSRQPYDDDDLSQLGMKKVADQGGGTKMVPNENTIAFLEAAEAKFHSSPRPHSPPPLLDLRRRRGRVPEPELHFDLPARRLKCVLVDPRQRLGAHVAQECERALQVDQAIPGLGHERLWVAVRRHVVDVGVQLRH